MQNKLVIAFFIFLLFGVLVFILTVSCAIEEPEPPGGKIPAAPELLSCTAISSTQIDLAWADNSNNEDGFEIYRNKQGDYSLIHTT